MEYFRLVMSIAVAAAEQPHQLHHGIHFCKEDPSTLRIYEDEAANTPIGEVL